MAVRSPSGLFRWLPAPSFAGTRAARLSSHPACRSSGDAGQHCHRTGKRGSSRCFPERDGGRGIVVRALTVDDTQKRVRSGRLGSSCVAAVSSRRASSFVRDPGGAAKGGVHSSRRAPDRADDLRLHRGSDVRIAASHSWSAGSSTRARTNAAPLVAGRAIQSRLNWARARRKSVFGSGPTRAGGGAASTRKAGTDALCKRLLITFGANNCRL
jgi:hypothetical protein